MPDPVLKSIEPRARGYGNVNIAGHGYVNMVVRNDAEVYT